MAGNSRAPSHPEGRHGELMCAWIAGSPMSGVYSNNPEEESFVVDQVTERGHQSSFSRRVFAYLSEYLTACILPPAVLGFVVSFFPLLFHNQNSTLCLCATREPQPSRTNR